VSPVDEGVNQEQVGVFLARFAPLFLSKSGSWLVSGIIPVNKLLSKCFGSSVVAFIPQNLSPG